MVLHLTFQTGRFEDFSECAMPGAEAADASRGERVTAVASEDVDEATAVSPLRSPSTDSELISGQAPTEPCDSAGARTSLEGSKQPTELEMADEEFSLANFMGASFLGQTWLVQGLASKGVITPLHGAKILRAIGRASKSSEMVDTFDRGARLIIAHRRHKKGPRRK